MPGSELPLALAVLISGGGTTLRNLLERIEDGSLPARVVLVISSSSRAGGLEFAGQRSIPAQVVRAGEQASPEEYRDAIFGLCREAGAELVVMGGFLKHLLVPQDFVGRVMNIHPALIPSFCGHGYYGHRVHEAVLAYGAKVSGCTVHFADNEYDHGPIILQRTVDVRDDDTPETLAARVFAQECIAYPEAIRRFAAGRLEIRGRRVLLRGSRPEPSGGGPVG